MAVFADPGSGWAPFASRCLLCGADLQLDWADLSELSPSDLKNHSHDEWRRAASSGCPFCNIVISVVDDAREKHGCSIWDDDDYHRIVSEVPGRDYTLEGFQVFLGLNESTERYLLALEYVWMPLLIPVESGEQPDYFGTITVYLDGAPPLLARLPLLPCCTFSLVFRLNMFNLVSLTSKLTFLAEPDIFNTHLEPFSEIPRHAGSAKALNHARDWLTRCQDDHPDCSRSANSDKYISAPFDSWIRIVEICDEKLRLTPMKLDGLIPPYVALSYCWGSSSTLKTLSTNLERFRIGIDHRDLPPTLTDAVKVTRSLGFKYIWIDSLCIIQDSSKDWEEQSSLMASVYGNADLVLAASSASSTGDGFLKERKCYRESSLQLTSVQNKKSSLNLRYRLLQPKTLAPMLDPLDRRAWAFQERLLARRYLAIGAHDTSWTCMNSSACECEWWRVASIQRKEIINIKKLVQDATDEELSFFWNKCILRHYFTRELTVPSDNLVALSAIASVFQKEMRSKYCAGIWKHDLIPGLLWECVERAIGYALDDSAPSWSWASLSTLHFRVSNFTGIHPTKAQARALETETTMSTPNQFGSACSGFIKLWGRLWRAEVTAGELASSPGPRHLLKVEGHFENSFTLWFDASLIMVEVCLSDGAEEKSLRRVRRGEVQDNFYIGNAQESDKINLLMVPLWKENFTYGLILGRSSKDTTKFERIGVFHTRNLTAVDPRQHKKGGPDDCIEQELVII